MSFAEEHWEQRLGEALLKQFAVRLPEMPGVSKLPICFIVLGTRTPFQIRFLSDNFEVTDDRVPTKEAIVNPNGFKLMYEQFTSCT